MASPSESPQCSRCINATLQISRRHGRLDAFMERLGYRPMRCRSCNRRTYVRASRIPEKLLNYRSRTPMSAHEGDSVAD